MIFLQELADIIAGGTLGGSLAFLAAMGVIGFILGIAVYIYTSLALMKIAKKTGTEPEWLAWIPIANLYLLSKIAGMPWWPLLLILAGWIPVIGAFAILAFYVFVIIWLWKTFEAVGRPGWWAILSIIPIVNLLLIGIAAWGSSQQTLPQVNKK